MATPALCAMAQVGNRSVLGCLFSPCSVFFKIFVLRFIRSSRLGVVMFPGAWRVIPSIFHIINSPFAFSPPLR